MCVVFLDTDRALIRLWEDIQLQTAETLQKVLSDPIAVLRNVHETLIYLKDPEPDYNARVPKIVAALVLIELALKKHDGPPDDYKFPPGLEAKSFCSVERV